METTTDGRATMQAQLVSQWITSLAISVVCCSVLFIVFAGYIVQLHETTNLLTVRLEMLQARQQNVETDMTALRRTPVVNLTTGYMPPAPVLPLPEKATSENGMELSVTMSDDAKSDPAKDDLILSATGEISLPSAAMNPDIEKMMSEPPEKK